MAAKTRIPWTGSTWNFGRGCWPKDGGCLNCYATRQAIRQAGPGEPYEGLVVNHGHGPRWTGEVAFDAAALLDPIGWGVPRFVFVDSMSDIFYERFTDEQVAAGFGTMMLAPLHVYQCLTKREDRAVEFFDGVSPAGAIAAARAMGVRLTPRQAARTFALLPEDHPLRPLFRPGGVASCDLPFGREPRRELAALARHPSGWVLPHVWVGASCHDGESFTKRAKAIASLHAPAVRFLSLEPLTGRVDPALLWRLQSRSAAEASIEWVILGGESGPRSRPCEIAWLRELVPALLGLGVAVFVKQLGAHPLGTEADAAALRCTGTPSPNDGLVHLRLADRKGENPAEFPDDLLVQDFPPNVYLPAHLETP